MSDAPDDDVEALLKHVRRSLLYLAETDAIDALREISEACTRAIRKKPVIPPGCKQEPDWRFDAVDVAITANIDDWRYNGGDRGLGTFYCRHCAAIYLATYKPKKGTPGSSTQLKHMDDIVPASQWAAPNPVTCPDCKGEGKITERPQVYKSDNGVHEYKSDSCDLCASSGIVDPEKLREVLEERERLCKAMED